jgi:beta-glucosidase
LSGLLAGTAALAAAQQPNPTFAPQSSPQVEQRVQSILSQMTLDEKLSYIGGTGFFDVKPIPVPGLQVPLNPQLFQMDAGLGARITPASVRYPGGPVLAATWNPDRARDFGAGLGRDTRARGFFTILGPGMDFYRTPFGGAKLRICDRRRSVSGQSACTRSHQEDPGARRMGLRKALCL